MHRSSDSVAALATALAKAQVELVNPEKSLVASIPSDRRGEEDRSFRYAPLSRGLEIVRKTLGAQEIAVMQTTAVDPTSGTVNLTTLLAHTSGEWISSDWPVCRIADAGTPHRMGAALTYARRYALFTLVGIAGEDDNDAPDLNASTDLSQVPWSGSAVEPVGIELPTGVSGPGVGQRPGRNGRSAAVPRKAVLEPAQSATMRERLLVEIASLGSADETVTWARRVLGAKNGLTTGDAIVIEEAFAARVAKFDDPEGGGGGAPASAPAEINLKSAPVVGVPTGIDKSALTLGEPRRHRSKAHLAYVSSLSCLVCGHRPSDAHHLRFAQPRTLGRKVSDEFTVPLCRAHHREIHGFGDEKGWWKNAGIDPVEVARKLWGETIGASNSPIRHGKHGAASRVGRHNGQTGAG